MRLRLREGKRAGGSHGRVEARVEGWPRDAVGILVQDHDEVVARRVIELLDHQTAPSSGRRPMNSP